MHAAALSLQVHPQAMQHNVLGQVNFNGETNGGNGMILSHVNPGWLGLGPGQRDARHGPDGMFSNGSGFAVDSQLSYTQSNRSQMVSCTSLKPASFVVS